MCDCLISVLQNGFTALHVACKKNRIKVIELLLRYGALIESTTEVNINQRRRSVVEIISMISSPLSG